MLGCIIETQNFASLQRCFSLLFQAHRLVEDDTVVGGILVDAEIADAFELVVAFGVGEGEVLLDPAVLNGEGVGVEAVQEGFALFAVIGIGLGEEAFEEADFGFLGVGDGDPVDGGFHLAVAQRHAALGLGVVSDVDGGDVAVGVLVHVAALDDVAVLEAHFAADGEAVELLVGHFAEVGALNPEFLGEGHFAGAGFGILGVVDGIEHLHLIVREVVDDELHGVDDGHGAGCHLVEVFAGAELEQ